MNSNSQNSDIPRINVTYGNLRTSLGILAMALPFILFMGNGFTIQESISHYYYTNMSVVFTGTLISFGLLLISYKGYSKKNNELLSDNLITNSAGVLAIIVAFIPTACAICDPDVPNGHNDYTRCLVHLISAGVFIVLMGYMSFVQFSKSEIVDETDKRRRLVYKLSGLIIWAVVLFLVLEYIFDYKLTKYDTFWGESLALIFFGISWLVKSESLTKIGLKKI